jgi:putative endonuclease
VSGAGTTTLRRDAERWGRFAESLCVLRLRVLGWRIISRRLAGRRGSGAGEIDIVARRGRVLAFIEVKARATHEDALYAVSPQQQARVARAAAAFLARHAALADLDVRFDVMTVGRGLLPTHLPDAWRP